MPGLDVDDVTILDSAGQLLASGDDASNSSLNRSLNIVQNVQQEVESNIDKALAPFLGMDNFRSSVTADLNTDAQQIQETTYDPESKVERSVRSTKEAQKSQQKQSDSATTVEQNMPQAAPEAGGSAGPEIVGPVRQEAKSRPTTKSTARRRRRPATAIRSKSFRLPSWSTRAASPRWSASPPTRTKVDAYLAEMQKIVASAAGIDAKRGDVVTVTAMDFLENQLLEDATGGVRVMDMLSRNMAGIINSLAFVVVAFLIVWMGFRPLVRSVSGNGSSAAFGDATPEAAGLELPDFAPASGAPGGALMDGFGSDFGFDSTEDLLSLGDDDGNFNRRVKEGPERKLSRMVEINEERAAKILSKWAIDEAA